MTRQAQVQYTTALRRVLEKYPTRALCPACEGRGVVLTAPWPSWAPPDIRPEADCPECGGEGLVPLLADAAEDGEGLLRDFPPEEPLPF